MDVKGNSEALVEEFMFFEDWQERYEYVIGLGKGLASLGKEYKSPERAIKGCQSQVWLHAQCDEDGRMRFLADSDSLITKGMIALFVRVLDGALPTEVLQADLSFVDSMGLKEHLAPTRANALSLMANEMKRAALEYVVEES